MQQPARASLPISVLIPAIAFLLVIAAGAYFYSRQVSEQRNIVRERQAANEQAGLPRDYPQDVVPLYAGSTVLKAERGDAMSTDGRPMDKWYIHAQSPDKPKQVFEYYNKLMLDQHFQQSYYSSIPTGFGVRYANELYDIDFIIETRQAQPETQIEITLHRLRR